jgi:hypothetical protein
VPLGCLSDASEVYLLNGPQVWMVKNSASVEEHRTPLSDGICGVRAGDEFAISDGPTVGLWHPTRPWRDISIFPDRCPADMAGRVVALQSAGPFLVALYEKSDGSGVMVYWGRWFGQDWAWHPRSVWLTGGYPLSCGSPMVLSERTVSAKRRLWVCAATGTTTDLYRQNGPLYGWDPLGDTTLPYESAAYLYTRRYTLAPLGDSTAILREILADARVSGTEIVTVAWRDADDPTLESAAVWKPLYRLDKARRSQVVTGSASTVPRGVQFRLGLARGATTTATPVYRGARINLTTVSEEPKPKRT